MTPTTAVSLRKPPPCPWYGEYHFRYDCSRQDGSRAVNDTKIRAISVGNAEETLRNLLGSRRYQISFLGMADVPMAEWPAADRVLCGVTKEGEPAATPPTPISSLAEILARSLAESERRIAIFS